MDHPPIPPSLTPEQATAIAAAAKEFDRELWILLSSGALVTMLRTYSRVRAVGFRGLQPDDFLAWVAMILYGIESGLAYSVGAYAHGLANNGMTDAHRAALPINSEEHKLRIIGSVIQLCGWSTYSTLLWSLKFSWLYFYMRLMEGLGRRHLTRLRIYIGLLLVLMTWLAVLLNIFLGCRPFRHYWQINPDPGNMCQPAIANNIIWLGYSLNISTDMYLISIPIPILWGSRLDKWKKAGLVFLFSGGLFIMVCASVRCYYIITNPVQGAQQAGAWAVRETFVALATTNLPLVFPLVKGWLAPLIGSIGSVLSSKLSSPKLPGIMARRRIRTFGQGSQTWRGPSTANPIPESTANYDEESMSDHVMVQDINMPVKADRDAGPGSTKGLNIQKSVQVAVTSQDAIHHATGDRHSATVNKRPWDRAHQGQHSTYAQGPEPTLKRSSETGYF